MIIAIMLAYIMIIIHDWRYFLMYFLGIMRKYQVQ